MPRRLLSYSGAGEWRSGGQLTHTPALHFNATIVHPNACKREIE